MASIELNCMNSVVKRLRDLIECKFCLKIKSETDVLFFRTCHHFLCVHCAPSASSCPICLENTEKPLTLNDDKNMLELYRHIEKLKMPAIENIQRIVSEHKSLMSHETVIFEPNKQKLGNVENVCDTDNSRKRQTEVEAINEKSEIAGTSAGSEQSKERKAQHVIKAITPPKMGKSKEEKPQEVNKAQTPTRRQQSKKKKAQEVSEAETCKEKKPQEVNKAQTPTWRQQSKKKKAQEVSEAETCKEKKPQEVNKAQTPTRREQSKETKAQQVSKANTPTEMGKSEEKKPQDMNKAQTPTWREQSKETKAQQVSKAETCTNKGKNEENKCQQVNKPQTPTRRELNKEKKSQQALPVQPKNTDTHTNKSGNNGARTPKTTETPPARGSSRRKVNVAKRNHKGETLLHLACKKCNLDAMKDLVEAGANPNAQDNAGWTPLHDAVALGNTTVVKFLLDHGAKTNTPGLENKTPLHLSVQLGDEVITQLLMAHGADCNARNIYGKTPLELAMKNLDVQLVELLRNSKVTETHTTMTDSPPDEKIVLWSSGLTRQLQRKFQQFCLVFDVETTTDVKLKNSTVTHVIVSSEEDLQRNFNLLCLVCQKACKWVVKMDWITESLRCSSLKPPDMFEICGPGGGFQRARQCHMNQIPDLLSGCHLFFGGRSERYTVEGFGEVTKTDIQTLCEGLGAVLLKRSPDPESLALEKTVPYHASEGSALAKCSYYILYSKDGWNPQPKYNMAHIKTLPIEWLLACLLKYELVDPAKMQDDCSDWLKK